LEFAVTGKNYLMFEIDNPVHLAKKVTVVLANFIIAQQIAHNAKKLSDKE